MSINEELRDLVAASCAGVLAAIDGVPDDQAFVSTQDESGKTAADYSLLVAQDKAMMAIGLGSKTSHLIPPALSTRDDAKTLISSIESDLENQILGWNEDDWWKSPSALGYPIDCDLPTYRDCVVAHAGRDNERADAIEAIFE